MSVLKKRLLPHVRLQQTNKHNAFKLFFIEQIQMQFVFTLHLPPGNDHKAYSQQLHCVCYSMRRTNQ